MHIDVYAAIQLTLIVLSHLAPEKHLQVLNGWNLLNDKQDEA